MERTNCISLMTAQPRMSMSKLSWHRLCFKNCCDIAFVWQTCLSTPNIGLSFLCQRQQTDGSKAQAFKMPSNWILRLLRIPQSCWKNTKNMSSAYLCFSHTGIVFLNLHASPNFHIIRAAFSKMSLHWTFLDQLFSVVSVAGGRLPVWTRPRILRGNCWELTKPRQVTKLRSACGTQQRRLDNSLRKTTMFRIASSF